MTFVKVMLWITDSVLQDLVLEHNRLLMRYSLCCMTVEMTQISLIPNLLCVWE